MKIPVSYEGLEIGNIEAPDTILTRIEGGIQFRYAPKWQQTQGAFPISIRMPLEQDLHPADILVPWLANLLPEGDPLRRVGQKLGISPEDILGVLDRVGRDTAGALSIGPSPAAEQPDYQIVEQDKDLERILKELPRKPFLVGEDGVSMSLAGFQEKLPVAMVDGQVAIPLNSAPSTHILKPANSNLFGSVQNEALCMMLARRADLDVAEVSTGRAGKTDYLIVTRYDRRQHKNRWIRVHQEDFCQALGRMPAEKYQHSQTGIQGPSVRDLIMLAKKELAPGDVLKLLDAVIFNILTANVDSHAKNYSLLFKWGAEQPVLAPLYDLMSGEAWEGITRNHAQDIGGQRNGRHIHGKHWLRMAEECELSGSGLLGRIEVLGNRLLEEITTAAKAVEAMPAGGHKMLPIFEKEIRDRTESVIRNLKHRN